MKTVFFESLRYKFITKKWFLLRLLSWYSYYDSDSQKENQLLLLLQEKYVCVTQPWLWHSLPSIL